MLNINRLWLESTAARRLAKVCSRSPSRFLLVVASTKDTIVDLWFLGPFVYCSVHIYIYSSSVMLPVRRWRQQITCHFSPSRTLHRRFPLSWHAFVRGTRRSMMFAWLQCAHRRPYTVRKQRRMLKKKIGQKERFSCPICVRIYSEQIFDFLHSIFFFLSLSLSLARARTMCSLIVNYDHCHRVEKWKVEVAVSSPSGNVLCVYL